MQYDPSRVSLHRENLVQPFLNLRDFLAVDGRTTIPPLGKFIQAKQKPTNTLVRLTHRPDGLFLIIGGITTYPVISQVMPYSHRKRMSDWKRYVIEDTTNHRVYDLYQTKDGYIGSRWECADHLHCGHIYSSRDLKPHEQEQRRLDRLFAPFPDRYRDNVMNLSNSITKLLEKPRRPYHLTKYRWVSIIQRARHNLSGEALETATTLALKAYNERPANRTRHGSMRGLGEWNEMRREVLKGEVSMDEYFGVGRDR